jgi:small nuclear ribonucleoprotein (snRNP)-like protein
MGIRVKKSKDILKAFEEFESEEMDISDKEFCRIIAFKRSATPQLIKSGPMGFRFIYQLIRWSDPFGSAIYGLVIFEAEKDCFLLQFDLSGYFKDAEQAEKALLEIEKVVPVWEREEQQIALNSFLKEHLNSEVTVVFRNGDVVTGLLWAFDTYLLILDLGNKIETDRMRAELKTDVVRMWETGQDEEVRSNTKEVK